MKLKLYILSLVVFLPFSYVFGQATVGSDEPPATGALLQLKERQGITGGNANADRGLGMPRVHLSEPDNLFPMFEPNGSNSYKIGSVSYVKSDEDKKHIGLCVFNTNKNLYTTGKDDGLYVWNGEYWKPLIFKR